jgi:SOS response regulatory protein OraA/RecX
MTSIDDKEFERCYKRAIFHLGRRALSSFKLREKLSLHFSKHAIEQCIQLLQEKKYLDDKDYLLKKMESGKRKGKSSFVILKKMEQEGFDLRCMKNDFEEIKTADSEEEDLETLLNYLKNKKNKLLLDREKLYRHLAYKGHSYSTIEKIWQKLTSEINH